MAVEEITIASELMVNVEDGVNARGIPVIRARRYDGVKPAANAAGFDGRRPGSGKSAGASCSWNSKA
ncbi:MAG: DUF1659 domain-containing protein [Syntrophothermaceae bacterium]